MKPYHHLKSRLSFVGKAAMLGAALLAVRNVSATPYASSVTNNNGTIQFYINESGANVKVTYEDGSVNPNFDGVTQGTNTPSGVTNFLLAGHSSYKISVTKVGKGVPSQIGSTVAIGTARGVDVNKNFGSPYFGRIYQVNGGSGVVLLNPDLTPTYSGAPSSTAGVTSFGSTGTGPGTSPYRLSVAADDFVIVGNASTNGSAVYRIDPTFATNQLLLGPVGLTNALAHGTIESRPLVTGSLAAGNLVLYTIDGELQPYNSIQVYDIGSGPLPWTNAPTYTGAEVGVPYDSIYLGGNEYPGLTMGTNGYLYASTYRNAVSAPVLQIYDPSGSNNLWNSWQPDGTAYPGGTATNDYTWHGFTANGSTSNPYGCADSAVSVDGNYFIGESIYNGVTIFPLTNGIPNTASVFYVNPSSITANGRGVAWDAADNYYISSSGIGGVQAWSLGITATAVTMGNASGQTNYAFVLPGASVSVAASTPLASETGPTPGVFTISRNTASPTPLTVNFSLGGTAGYGTLYTLSPALTNSITIAAGMTSTNISVIPIQGVGSLPTTTVTLTLIGGGSYNAPLPNSATVSVQNTGPQLLQITSVKTPTIYKGLTNDPGYFVVTRYGNTNAATYYASGFTYGGTATSGEFVPAGTMEFDPGTISVTNFITPLIDTTNYVGTKTVTIALAAQSGYSVSNNAATISILDNQYPPATVIFSDALTSPSDAVNWAINSANDNMPNDAPDNTINFGYDLTSNNSQVANNGLIPLPPNGATSALRITVNKSIGAASGVNLYLTNLFLTGDYAVRFSMDLVEGDVPASTTEGAIYGVNHSGKDTNWWSGSSLVGSLTSWSNDGIWYWISVDGGASLGSYVEFTGVSGSNGPADTGWSELGSQTTASYSYVYQYPLPYSAGPGLIGNSSPSDGYYNGGYTNAWSDVEIRTVHNVVTMSINKTVIYTYTNTTSFTNGYLMLGYEDPFDSIGGSDAAVFYSGLQVVSLSAPYITGITSASSAVTITFMTSNTAATAASFTLQSSPTVQGTYAPAGGAVITELSPGTFQAVVSVSGPSEFYRVSGN